MATTQRPTIKYRHGINPLYANMYSFRQETKVTDFVVSGTALDSSTQYTAKGSGYSTRSSQAPRGFDTIDTWIDFCLYMDAGEYNKAIGLYYRLKRFLNI